MAGQARNLAEDWITIWQSELAAAAADPERLAAWNRMVGLWGEAARLAVAAWPTAYTGGDAAPGPATPEPPPGSPAAAAAPDAGLETIRELARRVAELERRLAAIGEPGQG